MFVAVVAAQQGLDLDEAEAEGIRHCYLEEASVAGKTLRLNWVGPGVIQGRRVPVQVRRLGGAGKFGK
ncbi:hypothetical protein [Streptomyces sp. NPDC058572]|uniref:hypothetical protein n=1 Tax=Streptomyces sp. NPDC058572 TaxID=3346546 RepID=UPI00364EFFC9